MKASTLLFGLVDLAFISETESQTKIHNDLHFTDFFKIDHMKSLVIIFSCCIGALLEFTNFSTFINTATFVY